ncbi:MAG: divergent polysaccharide deacetylase family protein [Janthinobacterium lividum]
MILDANTSPRSLISDMAQEANLPCAQTIFQIDTDLSSEDIKSKLFMLEQQALKDGKAIGYAFVNDLTLETIASWSKTLSQRGIALAPLTYLIRK